MCGPSCVRLLQLAAVAVPGGGVLFEGDLLVADLFGDVLLLGDGFRAETDALDRDGFLVHDDAVRVERHLVLFLGERWPVSGSAKVRVRDGLPFHAHFFMRDRDRDGLLLGDDVLAKACAAGLRGFGAHVQLLLGARHGVVRVAARRVVAGTACRVHVAIEMAAVDVTIVVGVAADAASGKPVVAVEALFFLRRELPVGADAGRILDGGLVVADGEDAVVRIERGVGDGDEALGRAEETGVDGNEVRLALVVADVDLVDGADLVTIAVDDLRVEQLGGGVGVDPCRPRAAGPGLRVRPRWRRRRKREVVAAGSRHQLGRRARRRSHHPGIQDNTQEWSTRRHTIGSPASAT